MQATRTSRRTDGADGAFAPAAGEAVRYSARRSPPVAIVSAALATPLAGLGIASGRPLVLVPLVVCAALLVAAGLRAERASWLQRYWITDRRIVVEERDGAVRSLALERVVGAVVRGQRVAFTTGDGEELSFRVVRAPVRLARRLPAWIPGILVEWAWDPTGYS